MSRRGLETEEGSITGAVSSAGGPGCEELRDVGQQVGLPRPEGELRGGVRVDVEVAGHCQAQFDVSRGCGCLWTGVALTVETLQTIASPCWSVAHALPVLSVPELDTELTLGLTVTDTSDVLTASRHGVAIVFLRIFTSGAVGRVWPRV